MPQPRAAGARRANEQGSETDGSPPSSIVAAASADASPSLAKIRASQLTIRRDRRPSNSYRKEERGSRKEETAQCGSLFHPSSFIFAFGGGADGLPPIGRSHNILP